MASSYKKRCIPKRRAVKIVGDIEYLKIGKMGEKVMLS